MTIDHEPPRTLSEQGLYFADEPDADFANADLTGANFHGSDVTGASFAGATGLDTVDWDDCTGTTRKTKNRPPMGP